jgi:hypothetical protein
MQFGKADQVGLIDKKGANAMLFEQDASVDIGSVDRGFR